ncbi:MAG: ABC transporter substrate-binding protein [Limnochordia bacterium]|jgi:multiple sugar transport system substrate-binding protein
MQRTTRMVVTALLMAFVGIAGVALAAPQREIVVWMAYAHVTDEYKTWFDKQTERFERENPGASVRFEYIRGINDKLLAASAAGVAPDMTHASIAYARSLYEAGVLLELDRFIADTPHLAPDNFLPTALVFCQKDGQTFGVPWTLEAAAVLYNRDHMNEAGLDERPESMATWDDLVQYAQRLRQIEGDGTISRSGYVSPFSSDAFASYLYSNGGSFYSSVGTEVAFNSEEGVQALQFMYDLHHRHDVRAPGARSTDLSNRTASMVYWETSCVNWSIRPVAPDFAEWLGMAAVPAGPQGKAPSGVGWSNMFTIPRGAKNPELAWAWISQWLRPQTQVEFFEHFGSVNVGSPRRDFYGSSAFSRAVRSLPHLGSISTIFNNAQPYPHIRFSEINRQMTPLLSRVSGGTLAPATALAECERMANGILTPN